MREKLFLSLLVFLFFIIFTDIFANYFKIKPRFNHSKFEKFKTYGWYTWDGADHLYGEHSKQTNSFKTRGKVPDKNKKIILLGDSMVETSHELDKMPASILERKISNYSVVSLGSWGWGQDQQLLHLKKIIKKIKPKVVVLWWLTNDIEDNINELGFGGYKPTFKLVNNQLKYPKNKMDEINFFAYAEYSYYVRSIKYLYEQIKKKIL